MRIIICLFLALIGCKTLPVKQCEKCPEYSVTEAHLIKRKLFIGILWRDIPFEDEDGQRDMIRRGEIAELTKGIVTSPEFYEQIQPKDSPIKIVEQMYRGILGRDLDDSGRATYVDSGMPYDLVAQFLVTSKEFAQTKLTAQPLMPKPDIPPDPVFPKRTGKVSLSGKALRDDQGEFFAIGATLFSAARWYKTDRARLERNLKTLAENGFDYARVLGTVMWSGREIDPRWSDYADVISGLTDLAYDKYGIRLEWTIFGDAQLAAPTFADKQRVVDQMLTMSRGREHKILSFEIANESWQNGFGGDQGVAEIRQLAKYLKDRTDIIVAVSAPPDGGFDALYSGDVADFVTLHLDRTTNIGPDFDWRTVRQPWGEPPNGQPVSSNEPIGPGSSVACIQDPLKLASHAVVAFISSFHSYVYHSIGGISHGVQRCGLDSDQDLSEMPGIGAFKAMKKYLPSNLSNWTRENHYWAGHPFKVYGDGQLNFMTTDGARNGVMRAYAAHSGANFVVALTRIVGTLVLEAKSNMEFDMIDIVTGEVLSHHILSAGAKHEVSGHDAVLLKGIY